MVAISFVDFERQAVEFQTNPLARSTAVIRSESVEHLVAAINNKPYLAKYMQNNSINTFKALYIHLKDNAIG